MRPAGSSPLTRGKRLDGPEGALDAGLIPAHAGKTASNRLSQISAGAHPRSRGENAYICRTCYESSGSSPLTRGKRERYEP